MRLEEIPVKERFGRHARSRAVPPEVLREAASRLGWDFARCTFERLSGGYQNANFKVLIGGEGPLLLRVYSDGETSAPREAGLLRKLAAYPGIRAARIHAEVAIDGRALAVLEFVEGVTLEDRLLEGGPPPPAALYRELGAQLAAIHGVAFERAGFLGPDAEPGDEYADFGRFLRDYVLRSLASLPEARLGSATRARLRRLVEARWDELIPPRAVGEAPRQLVHCDFNPKNLLVSCEPGSAEVRAVLDWEFGLAGDGLADLGNFFRFEHDHPPGAADAFISGYRAAGGRAPDAWRDAGRMMDLANQVSFLERREDLPETFRTARAVIDQTLAQLGS